jgi:4-amino-4-deoxy-L-arabinose transferase-like glycosyltransferase
MSRRCLLVILGLALLLRVANALYLPWQGDEMIISDMQAYDRSAMALLNHEPLGVHTSERYLYHPLGSDTYHPPGYYYFLAAIYAVAGHRYWVVRLAQALMDTCTCLLLYHVGRRIAGEPVGLLSAALAAIYPPFIMYTGLLLTETLSMFLLVAAVLLAFRSVEERPWQWAMLAGAGVLLGWAALTRSILLVMAPVILLWLVVLARGWPGWATALRCAALLVLPIVLVIAPVTVRNYQLHHRLILISTNGGVNFFLGYGGTEQMKLQVRNVPDNPLPGQLIGISVRTEPEEDAYFYQLGWEYIRQSPLRALRHLPGKLKEMYWSSSFWPATEAQLAILESWDRVLWRLVILPLGMVSVLLQRSSVLRRGLLLYGLGLASLVIPVIFWAQPRFRMSIVPFVMVLASASAVALVRALRLRLYCATQGATG